MSHFIPLDSAGQVFTIFNYYSINHVLICVIPRSNQNTHTSSYTTGISRTQYFPQSESVSAVSQNLSIYHLRFFLQNPRQVIQRFLYILSANTVRTTALSKCVAFQAQFQTCSVVWEQKQKNMWMTADLLCIEYSISEHRAEERSELIKSVHMSWFRLIRLLFLFF